MGRGGFLAGLPGSYRSAADADPIFEKEGVIHYCVTNMPGAVPRTSTQALTNATMPYGRLLAELGVEEACRRDGGLMLGLNCYDGKCTFRGVAEALNLSYVDPRELLL